LGSRAKVRLGPRTAREPDICFLSTERAHLLRQQEIAGAPDLVVEIITSDKGRSEALAKRTQYETAGVQELWLLDFPLRRLHFLLLKDGLYGEAVLEEADTVSSQVVPGFRVAVAVLLSPVGQYPPQWPIVEGLLQAPAGISDNRQWSDLDRFERRHMHQTRWLGMTGAAATLAFGLLVGCTSREEPAATAPPGTATTGGQARDAAPAVGMKEITLNVKGMTWPVGWPPKVEAALVRVDGFEKMKADVTTQTVKVTYDPAKTTPEAMAKAITDGTDFTASVPQSAS
jgi:copper chaperone CopZ